MGIFKTDELNETEKMGQMHKKYEKYIYAAILLDKNFNVIYKNDAAKMLNIKPRISTNIKKYTNQANSKKLCEAVERGEYGLIKLDVASPIKRCVIQPESKEVTALLFYDALNFLKESDKVEFDTIRKIENIIAKYNERRKSLIIDRGDYFPENNRKIIRINEHFRRHMANLNSRRDDTQKAYCDIGDFLNNFAASISQYTSAFGYKVNFNIEDKMFYYKLSESDLLLVNFIMSAFAFKHSIFNKVDISFRDEYSAWILRYEFITDNEFLKTYEDIFIKNHIDHIDVINGIEYLDLNLACLIAKNNNLKLRIYLDEETGNKVVLDLIFANRHNNNFNVESPNTNERRNYISREKMKKHAEIEFSMVFGI